MDIDGDIYQYFFNESWIFQGLFMMLSMTIIQYTHNIKRRNMICNVWIKLIIMLSTDVECILCQWTVSWMIYHVKQFNCWGNNVMNFTKINITQHAPASSTNNQQWKNSISFYNINILFFIITHQTLNYFRICSCTMEALCLKHGFMILFYGQIFSRATI